MISFGFTVYKFMQYLHQEGKPTFIRTERGARNFGRTLMAVGIISLLIACVQYGQLEKRIHPGKKWPFRLTQRGCTYESR
jgi:uncharacterized membrane protein YidH (DUF202 family)